MYEQVTPHLHAEIAGLLGNVIIVQQGTEARLETQAERWHETSELFSMAGNHEAKMATSLIFVANPEGVFSFNPLGRLALKRQGPEPGWAQNAATTFNYCGSSLAPAGLIVETTTQTKDPTKSGLARAYAFDKSVPDHVLAVLGLTSDWSLKWEDISLQDIVGAASSAGKTKAAESRFNIFIELLTSPHMTVAESDVDGLSNILRHTSNKAVEQLERLGFLKVERVMEDNDRVLEVIHTEYTHDSPLTDLLLETQLVYEYLRQSQPGDRFTQQQLLDYVTGRVSELEPSQDLATVRDRLTAKISGHDVNLPGIKRIGTYSADGRKKTRVSLKPEYVEPVTELMQIVMDINDRNPERIAEGKQRAVEIAGNTTDIHDLMAKAGRFSGHKQTEGSAANEAAIQEQIDRSEVPLSVDDLLSRLKDEKPQMAREVVEECARRLAVKGSLNKAFVPKSHTNRRRVAVYSANTG